MTEHTAIELLNMLDNDWPQDLWLWAASGTLHLMQGKPDGGRYMLPSGKHYLAGVDPKYIIATFSNITCDGGDW